MLRNKPILWFFVRLCLLYGLLIIPWPGFNEAYGRYFSELGNIVFDRDDGKRIVRFEAEDVHHGVTSLNAKVTLGNRDLMDATGHGPAHAVDFDTRSIGWVPTALTMALILATPVPWKRRLMAFGFGFLLIHLFILFSIQTWIWNESTELSLVDVNQFGKMLIDGLEYTTITQMGISFFAPILIWLLVTFRRSDMALLPQNVVATSRDHVQTKNIDKSINA